MFAIRTHGTVTHILRTGNTSLCGRYVMPSASPYKRLCGTCHRIQPSVSIPLPIEPYNLPQSLEGAIEAKARKTLRDNAIQASMDLTELPEASTLSWEYALTALELEMTLEKINKINERCTKRGIPGGLNVEWSEETRINKSGPINIEYIVYKTRITGIAPVIPGWEFIATVDHDPYAGMVIRTYPGIASVDRSQLREGRCDHCQTNRQRNETYLVRNTATGEQIQVGSSCIKDFTGWTCLPYTFDKDRKALEESYGNGSYDVTVLTALAIAWACVTEHGYVKTSEARSTRNLVSNVIWPPKNLDFKAKQELEFLRAYAGDMAAKALELQAWILSDEFTGYGEYVLNLKAVARASLCSVRNLGLLCSAPQAWARHLEKAFIAKVEESKAVSEYLGEIGERWEIPLTVESERFIESAYGSTTLYRMLDAKGSVFKWFASNGDLEVGNTYTLGAGIKRHSVWQGVQETTLTRCKVVADIPEARKVKDAAVKAPYELRSLDDLNISDIYMVEGRYYRIRTTKGVYYAQRHTEDGWEYAIGAIRDLTPSHKLTADQAAMFGHTYGACVYCHKALTDERSTSVGYGPECADKHELPWG